MTERKCGGCTACCKTHAVNSISKPAGVWCNHCEIAKGCLINTQKPQACRNFKCLWLNGFFSEQERPDKTGVVADISEPPILNQKAILLLGLQSDSLTSDYAIGLTYCLLKQNLVVVHGRPDGSYNLVFFPSQDSFSRARHDWLEQNGIKTFVS